MSRIARLLRDNALGLVALTIALSAGAYAVDKAPKNSVVSSSIRKGAVKGGDVKDDSLTGKDIKESTLVLPSGPAGAGGTVTSVTAGAGLEGGTITKSGAFRLATCPASQLLKSNGSGYDCADDTDTDTTYAAGTGLQLDGTTFSITDGGIGTAQVADSSLVAADLGTVQSMPAPSGTFLPGACALQAIFVAGGAGVPGDFVLATTMPVMPTGFVVTAQVGPLVGDSREYFVSLCNHGTSTQAIQSATLKLLVISQ